jgi:hypothetical protein
MRSVYVEFKGTFIVFPSFVDPRHFGTDPDPGIRNTALRIRNLLFCQCRTKCQQKIKFFVKIFLFGTYITLQR